MVKNDISNKGISIIFSGVYKISQQSKFMFMIITACESDTGLTQVPCIGTLVHMTVTVSHNTRSMYGNKPHHLSPGYQPPSQPSTVILGYKP